MGLTRRQLLTTFLGAPFAAAACQSAAAPTFPEGEFVGQSVSVGHLLREDRSFVIADQNWETRRAVIIGAGIAGLTAGWELQRKGFDDFAVLELEKEIGGTARSGIGDPVPYPWGAHYLPVPFKENHELVSLLDEMGLTEGRDAAGEVVIREQYLCREPEERVFYKGRWYDGLYLSAGASDEDLRQLNDFQREIDRLVSWRDSSGRRAFAVPLANSSSDPEVTSLDRMSFAEWLDSKGFTSERLRWYCDYATRDDYGLKADQASAWVGLFYFCSRVRQSGSESQPFITFPEGNGRFAAHLSGKIVANIRPSQMAVAITPTKRGADIISFSNGQTTGIRCEKVIYASPIFTAPYLIRGFRDEQPFAAAEFQHNAWFVANLHLTDRPKPRFARDFPLSWDNVIYESPSLGYVTATHQKGIDHGPTTLTYYYPMCAEENGRTKLFNYEWKDLAEVCLSDLERAHRDIRHLTKRIDIMRWGHAMISPRPNFIWSGVREQAMKPHRNIHFAHTDLSGVALFEEAFYHGSRAAAEVMKAVGSG